jgi:hypothetical protein
VHAQEAKAMPGTKSVTFPGVKAPLVAYRNLRVLLAVGALLIVLGAGAVAVNNGAPLSDVGVPILILLVLFAVFVVRYTRQTRGLVEADAYRELVRETVARRAERDRGRRILGALCVDCSKRIVVEADGVNCSDCDAPVHRDCVGHHRAQAHTSTSYRA